MIRIVTDSTANLTDDLVSQHGVEVVPLRVIFPDATFRDGIDITPDEFYRKLTGNSIVATTSQPPAAEFAEAFARLAADGDEVLAIVISEKLSGTMASAVAAQREMPGARIEVFDSKVTSGPMAFMVDVAARMAAAGASMDEVLAALAVLRDKTQMLFVVDTLEYLQRGGRIGGAAALAGSLLRIKPVLTLRDGRVEAWGKVRGKRKALQMALEAMKEQVGEGPSVRTAVIHASCEEEARAFQEEVSQALCCPPPRLYEFSPVIGVHVGPGTIALASYNESWL